ncbi:MAG: hypothetical protein V4555_05720 [Acidobacteriota bacterium]
MIAHYNVERHRSSSVASSLLAKFADPLITAITSDGHTIVESARPYFRCTTGKRTGGWYAFFDFPAGNPEGTRQFVDQFQPEHVAARTVGDWVEVNFDGMKMGIFTGPRNRGLSAAAATPPHAYDTVRHSDGIPRETKL